MSATLRFETLLVAGAVVGAPWANGCEGESFTRLTQPVLLVNVDAVEFGEIPVGFTVSKKITVANGGQQPLELSRITLDGSAVFGLRGEIARIAAGGEAEIVVTFTPSAESTYASTLLIESNASNAPAKAVEVRGTGVSATRCGDCTMPPPPACLTENDLVSYSETGVCVMGQCRYTASVESCAMGCDMVPRTCRGSTSNDASVSGDARANDAMSAADAGVVDAASNDAAAIDDCLADAGAGDSGLGAPQRLYDTPGEHTFTVPVGVSEIQVRMWGGGGQGGNQNGATGGGGAFVQARVPVTPSEVLDVWVAQGGAGSSMLGYGGGASYLRRGATDLLIAGGGGGGGSDGNSGQSMSGGSGGAGGFTGEPGADGIGSIPPFCTRVTGGGGTQSVGGAGGTTQGTGQYQCSGQPGGSNVGGRSSGTFGNCETTPGADRWRGGGGQSNGGGGGGGAGYFGGGGAGFIWTYCAGGGGGGSSYADSQLSGVVHEGGSGPLQGRAQESFGAGRGGARCLQASGAPPCTCNAGASGRVELRHP